MPALISPVSDPSFGEVSSDLSFGDKVGEVSSDVEWLLILYQAVQRIALQMYLCPCIENSTRCETKSCETKRFETKRCETT